MLSLDTAHDTGRRIAAVARPAVTAGQRWWARFEPIAPLVLVAVLLLLMARTFYFQLHFNAKPGWQAYAQFADIGTISGHHLGLNELVRNRNPTGFDGQFYYYMALDPAQPFICAHRPPTCALDDSFGIVRAERVLYAYTAGILTLGHPQWLPFTLLLVNLVAILVTCWLVMRLCLAAGASRWLGAVAALYCGMALGFLRDLADPYAVMWIVLTVYLFGQRRYTWGALAMAAALLTREQLILTLPVLLAPLALERRWWTLARTALIGIGPFLAWQVALWIVWGRLPLTSGDTQASGVAGGFSPVPFHGLFEEGTRYDFGLLLTFVAVPLTFAIAIAALTLRDQWRAKGWRGWLTDPTALFVAGYALLLSLTSAIVWLDMWSPTRLAAPAVVLAVVLAARLPRPQLRATYATLVGLSALAPFILVVR